MALDFFFIRLILLSLMISRFIHVVANGSISFFLMVEFFSVDHTCLNVPNSSVTAFLIRQALRSVSSSFMCGALRCNCSGIVTYGILPVHPHQSLQRVRILGNIQGTRNRGKIRVGNFIRQIKQF